MVRSAIPVLLLLVSMALDAQALTICSGSCSIQGEEPSGEITYDFALALDLEAGLDFDLSTSGRVYLAVPNGFAGETISLTAMDIIIEEGVPLAADEIAFCSSPQCELEVRESGDVYLQALSPLGAVAIQSELSIVISAKPLTIVPEPGTLGLAGIGALALALTQRVTRSMR